MPSDIRNRIIEVREIRAGELLPNPKNWRKHPKAQRDAMKGIWEEIGNAAPVIARQTAEGVQLLDGHLRASIDPDQMLTVAITDLDDEEADKFLPTYDTITMMAEPDTSALMALIDDAQFGNDAINAMLEAVVNGEYTVLQPFGDPPPTTTTEQDEANVEQALDEAEADGYVPFSKRGQIWKLGEHRLMCGDSGEESDVAVLLDEGHVEAIVTDPPYGINVTKQILGTGKKDFFRGEWDDKKPEILRFLKIADESVIWGGNYYADILPMSADWLCWHKKNDGLTFSEIELAWSNLGCNARHFAHHWSRELKQHPTQKPLPVIEWSLGYVRGKVIFDPFAGSGTTIIACEKLDRRCYAMEIEPRYVDVCIRRWEEFTGKKAELVSDGD